eukprot:184227-Alexandrium_andersonii.AAC.1
MHVRAPLRLIPRIEDPRGARRLLPRGAPSFSRITPAWQLRVCVVSGAPLVPQTVGKIIYNSVWLIGIGRE